VTFGLETPVMVLSSLWAIKPSLSSTALSIFCSSGLRVGSILWYSAIFCW